MPHVRFKVRSHLNVVVLNQLDIIQELFVSKALVLDYLGLNLDEVPEVSDLLAALALELR